MSSESSSFDSATISGARRLPLFPATFEPMLASPAEGPLGKAGSWVFEPKMDGIRCVVLIREGKAQLLSRRGNDLTSQYPKLAAELPRVFDGNAILDGEIIALDAGGKPSFQQLQQRMNLTRPLDVDRAERHVPVEFFVFDLLRVGDWDLCRSPLAERRRALQAVFRESKSVHLIPQFECEGVDAYEACVANGFEGIVAKRLNAPYECGRRSGYWQKVKAQLTGDFVVGGYTAGEGGRSKSFGALLLGVHDEKGALIYCGSVGTGFDEKRLRDALDRMSPLIQSKSPFKNPPKDKKGCVWVTPILVVEIKYMECTNDLHLRAPVFMHFREDIAPEQVNMSMLAKGSSVSPSASAAVPRDRETINAQATEKIRSSIQDRESVKGRSLVQDRPIEQDSTNRDPATGQAVNLEGDGLVERTDELLTQLEAKGEKLELLVGEERIALTSLSKPLWPAYADQPVITKRDYLRALIHLAPFILPHWSTRPVTLIRSPGGVQGKSFFQKYWHSTLPGFVQTVDLGDETDAKEKLLCSNLASLLYYGQNGVLEFHMTTSRIDDVRRPDFIVFDIDFHKNTKGPAELDLDAFARAKEVALKLHEVLTNAGLSSFVKLSGKNGIHVFVPIARNLDYTATRTLAETTARFIVAQIPELATVEFEIKKREGKVYLDCGQNGQGRTIAAAYTPRAVPWASISMPVDWTQLENVTPLHFTLHSFAQNRPSDLWAQILVAPNDLQKSLNP